MSRSPFLKSGLALVASVLLAACGEPTTTPDAGPKCPANETECGGTCTDTRTDDDNCGACGTACGTGTACVAGTCTATCGDGVKAEAEACDDGNTTAGDGCSASCEIEHGWACDGSPSACTTGCGDGMVAGAEACDDGNTTAGDGCSASCGIEEGYGCSGEPSTCQTTCGDAVQAGTEACDDGNTTAGDGCSDACAVEEGFTCSGAPSACTTTCGDSIIAGAEVCDDGNAAAGDGCSDTCATESGYTCTGTPSVCSTTCGDGVTAGAEACDDGDTTAGDGCSDTCAVESGFSCTGSPSACTTTCGDGVTAGSEACDDGNTAAADGCSDTCAIESGYSCTGAPSACTTTCGDGVMAGGETCDDGNTAAADGCSDTCATESGYSCTGTPSTCSTTCGDGMVAGAEACDDGATTAGDGCSDTCTVETGYACTGAPSTCAPVCGDGALTGTEVCDDGNTASGDGCNATCAAVEQGFTCSSTSPTTCTATCGDGIVVGAETCDDGNTTAGDGCSASCAAEPGYTCTGAPSTCTAAIACPAGSTFVAFAATDLPKPAPDVTTVQSDVTVAAAGVITAVGVGVNLDHTYDGDVDMYLVAPGATIELSTDNGGGGDHYTDTLFIDSAATSITSGSAPFTGEFRPEQPFSSLVGGYATGTWSLTVTDDAGGGSGTLNEFDLYLCVCTTCEIGDACGDTVDNDADGQTDCADPECTGTAACAVCGNSVVETGETCDDGNSTAGDGCGASCDVEVGYTCTGAPSVCTAALACPTGSGFLGFAATDLPKPVPDLSSAQSDLSVSAAGVVTAVGVGLTVMHGYDADLDISLNAPGGSVELSTDNGSFNDNYVDTVFADAAAVSITSGTAPFTGSYRPEQPFTAALGGFASGTWSLIVTDDDSGSSGTLTKYELYLCVCTTCETGAACGDSVDNDGDGNADCTDSDCAGSSYCAQCGNGVVETGEACDDGNLTGGDGCSAGCVIEDGYACTGTLSTCTPNKCGNATALTVAPGSPATVQVDTTGGTNDYQGSCYSTGTAATDGFESIYKVTLTSAQDLTVTAVPTATSGADPVIYVRSGACDSGTQLRCINGTVPTGGTLTEYDLPAGDYFIFIETYGTTAGPLDVTVALSGPTPIPANDTCAAPQVISSFPASITAQTLTAADDYSNSGCASSTGGDLVYEVVLTQAGLLTARVTPNLSASPGYEPSLYLRDSANCASTSSTGSLACIRSTGEGSPAEIATSLQAGTYYLIVDGSASSEGHFTLDVALDAFPVTQANEDCATAEALTLTNGTAVVYGTTEAAAGSMGTSCDTDAANWPEVVYSFTTPALPSGATAFNGRVVVNSLNGNQYQPVVSLRSNCASAASGDQLFCNSSSSSPYQAGGLKMALTPSTTYYVVVDSGSSATAAAGAGAFRLEVNVEADPVANDQCAGATPLTANASFSGSTLGATNDYSTSTTWYEGAAACTATFGGADVVYTYTPTSSGPATFVVQPAPGMDIGLAVLSACAQLSCLDTVDSGSTGDSEVLTLGVTAGETYYVVVDSYSTSTTLLTARGGFTLSVTQ